MAFSRTILITGGAGFIGSNLVLHLRKHRPSWRLVVLDALTYAGNLLNLAPLQDDPGVIFVRGDIIDAEAVARVWDAHPIDGVMHLAAESHVDRSIAAPLAFVQTNVIGTVVLLQEARKRWGGDPQKRFLHISTDEVFGSLGPEGLFSEDTAYDPRSPYSASKASSDHMVRAWHETYGLPVLITNCTNNYGPMQFPEKLIPVVVTRAASGQTIPVYGTGENVRDWLHVEDHCRALLQVFEQGASGETYCVGGEAEASNLDLVGLILDEVDRALGRDLGASRELIRFVKDRPGHDFRYAMDIHKIRDNLGWKPSVTLSEGIRQTVRWYLDNGEWVRAVQSGEHRAFQENWYAERGGAGEGEDK